MNIHTYLHKDTYAYPYVYENMHTYSFQRASKRTTLDLGVNCCSPSGGE